MTVPDSTGLRTGRPLSTQEAFGRILVDLSRDEAVAPYLVTAAPDVATSTNLAGFINRTKVFSPDARRSWSEDTVLKWAEGPDGHHIELGISEMNLFLLLGQLGLAWDLSDQPLLPVGTVYDPFVLRGLDAFIYSVYSGARFIVAGTPSGVTLAPEGGAHQSTITPSVGLELPGVTFIEPAYATALDWLLCGALQGIATANAAALGPTRDGTPVMEDGSYYFRLTTRGLDQQPFQAARDRLGDAVLRRQVLAGAYRLVDAGPPQDGTPDGPPGGQRGGAARGAGRRGRTGGGGHRRERGGRHLGGPALPGLAADAAPGSAHRHGAVHPRRAAQCFRWTGPSVTGRRSSPCTTRPRTR